MYYTYIKFPGIIGLLFGWTLIGISERKRTSGAITDVARSCGTVKVLLVQSEAPRRNFIFVPKEFKIVGSGTLSVYKQ